MSKIALACFTVAPLYGLIGMVWGSIMGASGDHSMMPAHAHLNLLGLVINGMMGAFYAFAGERISKRLAWTSFALWNVGVLVMIPILTIILMGNKAIAPAIMVGEISVIVGMVLFLANVLRLWRPKAA
jgi:hypothetical protein